MNKLLEACVHYLRSGRLVVLDDVVAELRPELAHDLGLRVCLELHHEGAGVALHGVPVQPHALLHALNRHQARAANVLLKHILRHVEPGTLQQVTSDESFFQSSLV